MTDPTELLPCPFCGGAPTTIERPDNSDGTQFFYAIACYCGRYSACAHKMAVRKTPEIAKADAIAAWNTRTPQPTQAQAGAVPQCWCLTCRPMRLEDPYSMRMALCPTCGNKRCPKANDHRNECTGSNEPGQPGSAYSGGIKGGQHGAE